MKKVPENNVKLRKIKRLTPFEKVRTAAQDRAILAKIHEKTREILESYEHLDTVAELTGVAREELEELADDAIIELAESMETHFGVSA